MSKIIRFDPKRRKSSRTAKWRPSRPPRKPSARERKGRRNTWRDAFREVWVWMLILFLVSFYAVFGDARRYGGPGFMQVEEGELSYSFTLCGGVRGYACVIDGDTFKLGDRRIRLIGIDTAEKDAQCAAEADQAARSTKALREWLNRGPFVMQTRMDQPKDRYGRDLRTLYRRDADGNAEYASDWMIENGGARAYWGYERDGWC